MISSQTKMSVSHGIGDWMFSRDGLRALQKAEISCVGRESNSKSVVVQQVAKSLHRLSSPGCQLHSVHLFCWL